MEQRKRIEALKYRLVDHGRFAIVRAVVYDAMADRCGEPADVSAQEGNDLVERRQNVPHLRGRPRFVDKVFAFEPSRDEVRLHANTLDLPFKRRSSWSPAATENSWNLMLELPAFTTRTVSVTALDLDGLLGYLTVPEKNGDGAGGHARSYIICPRCKDDRDTGSKQRRQLHQRLTKT